MPQVFRIGSYLVYFWANENKPLEPVRVHISQGEPMANATKFWITKSGKCLLANNNSGFNLNGQEVRRLYRRRDELPFSRRLNYH